MSDTRVYSKKIPWEYKLAEFIPWSDRLDIDQDGREDRFVAVNTYVDCSKHPKTSGKDQWISETCQWFPEDQLLISKEKFPGDEGVFIQLGNGKRFDPAKTPFKISDGFYDPRKAPTRLWARMGFGWEAKPANFDRPSQVQFRSLMVEAPWGKPPNLLAEIEDEKGNIYVVHPQCLAFEKPIQESDLSSCRLTNSFGSQKIRHYPSEKVGWRGPDLQAGLEFGGGLSLDAGFGANLNLGETNDYQLVLRGLAGYLLAEVEEEGVHFAQPGAFVGIKLPSTMVLGVKAAATHSLNGESKGETGLTLEGSLRLHIYDPFGIHLGGGYHSALKSGYMTSGFGFYF